MAVGAESSRGAQRAERETWTRSDVDTVIVYDPWWKPAMERQAMDGAHRIGQDKPVFVHRPIAENTVEAAIQRLQARKQALADTLFEGTGWGPLGLNPYRLARDIPGVGFVTADAIAMKLAIEKVEIMKVRSGIMSFL